MSVEIATRDAAACPLNLGPGLMLVVAALGIYGGLALTVDFPHAALGIQSDEATYYMMGHSLAEDGDLTYRREDLVRVWKEFDGGPTGLFLKQGRDILEAGPMLRPPFFWTRSGPACSTGSRSSTRSSPRRSCACSAPTGFSCCTRCSSRSSCGAATCSSTRG
jgi:hypothetical protein